MISFYLFLFIAFDSEIRQWASKYDELDHQKRRASDEKSELVEERNDLLDKLTFLEKDIGSVHDKLNSVIAENDDKVCMNGESSVDK